MDVSLWCYQAVGLGWDGSLGGVGYGAPYGANKIQEFVEGRTEEQRPKCPPCTPPEISFVFICVYSTHQV